MIAERYRDWQVGMYVPPRDRWSLVDLGDQLCAVDSLGIFPPICISKQPRNQNHPQEVMDALERLYPRSINR